MEGWPWAATGADAKTLPPTRSITAIALEHRMLIIKLDPPPLKWSTLSYGFCSPRGPQMPRKSYKPEEIVAKLRRGAALMPARPAAHGGRGAAVGRTGCARRQGMQRYRRRSRPALPGPPLTEA